MHEAHFLSDLFLKLCWPVACEPRPILWSVSAIAAHLDLDRETVRKYLAEGPQEYKREIPCALQDLRSCPGDRPCDVTARKTQCIENCQLPGRLGKSLVHQYETWKLRRSPASSMLKEWAEMSLSSLIVESAPFTQRHFYTRC